MKNSVTYVWLDGSLPEPRLRSKVKYIDSAKELTLEDIPIWYFDGSSTNQAVTGSSDCMLKPVRLYSSHGCHCYAFCEVCNADSTPHESNTRSQITTDDEENYWFGFEQEYFIYDKDGKAPIGWPQNGFPSPQGPYYCAVGTGNVAGRYFVDAHVLRCHRFGLDITGTNAEVALGQWEYQLLGKGTKTAGDDLWMSRYFLLELAEEYEYKIEFHPKPLGDTDWNGSGMHTNFSNKIMRDTGGEVYFDAILDRFLSRMHNHIAAYGSDNEKRLTGKHETAPIDQFKSGVSDRGASIRIPPSVAQTWKGYLEDRRPASNADPYRVIKEIETTVSQATEIYQKVANVVLSSK